VLADLIDIPWQSDGHSLDGCSCWGLVRLFYRTEMSIELPDIKNGASMGGVWYPVALPVLGDVLVFRVERIQRHVGIALDTTSMLHVDECKRSCIENFKGFTWNNRLLRIYRHRLSE
jgi:cell wall-associated NlpC family hydrolase